MIHRAHCPLRLASAIACLLASTAQADGIAARESPVFSIRLGNRFVIGETSYDNQLTAADTGQLASRLRWSDVSTLVNETTLRVTHESSGVFLKAYGGIGRNSGGALDDEDYAYDVPTPAGSFTGTFLDTYLKGDEATQLHGAVDLGFTLPLDPRWPVRLAAFVGGFAQRQDLLSQGARCNEDEAFNLVCGPPGSVVVPYDQNAIRFETTMHGARMGIEPVFALPRRLTLRTEAAWLFEGSFGLDDSHYLRAAPDDLGAPPNIVSDGDDLDGVQLEAELSWAATDALNLTVGARYWRFNSGRAPVVFGARLPTPADAGNTYDHNTIEQYGVTLGIDYRF